MNFSETIYLFAAKWRWTWLVRFLFFTGLIEGERIASTVDEHGHSALYHALNDEALATLLYEKAGKDLTVWPELQGDELNRNTKIRKFCDQAICASAGFLFDWIKDGNEALRQQMRTFISSARTEMSWSHSVHARTTTWFDYAIMLCSDHRRVEENKLVASISSLIAKKPSGPDGADCRQLALLDEQGNGAIFARALFSAAKYGCTEVVNLFLNADPPYLTLDDIYAYCDFPEGVQKGQRRTQEQCNLSTEWMITPGKTALDVAVEKGHESIVAQLIRFGVCQTESCTLTLALAGEGPDKINQNILSELLAQYYGSNLDFSQVYAEDSHPFMRHQQLEKDLKLIRVQASKDNNAELVAVLDPYVSLEEATPSSSFPAPAPAPAPAPDSAPTSAPAPAPAPTASA